METVVIRLVILLICVTDQNNTRVRACHNRKCQPHNRKLVLQPISKKGALNTTDAESGIDINHKRHFNTRAGSVQIRRKTNVIVNEEQSYKRDSYSNQNSRPGPRNANYIPHVHGMHKRSAGMLKVEDDKHGQGWTHYSEMSELSMTTIESGQFNIILSRPTQTIATNGTLSQGDTKQTTATNGTLSQGDTKQQELWEIIFDKSQLAMVAVGVIANSATLLTMVVNGQCFSPAILILLRNQSVVDALVCLIGLIILVQPFMWLPGTWLGDVIVCHVWHSQTIYWVCIDVSTWNLVAIAFERFLAVRYPFRYQDLRPKTIYSVLVFMYVVNSLSPVCLQTSLVDGGCVSEHVLHGRLGEVFFYAYSIYYFMIYYAIPTCLLIILYCMVIFSIRKRQRQIELASSRVIDKANAELTKTAVVVTVIFIIALGYDSWYYILGYTGVVVYKFNSPLQKVGIWLSSFNSVANPFVYVALMPAYQRNVKKTFRFGCPERKGQRAASEQTPVTATTITTTTSIIVSET